MLSSGRPKSLACGSRRGSVAVVRNAWRLGTVVRVSSTPMTRARGPSPALTMVLTPPMKWAVTRPLVAASAAEHTDRQARSVSARPPPSAAGPLRPVVPYTGLGGVPLTPLAARSGRSPDCRDCWGLDSGEPSGRLAGSAWSRIPPGPGGRGAGGISTNLGSRSKALVHQFVVDWRSARQAV